MPGPIYQQITLTLIAGESRDVNIYGGYLRVLSNSSATNPKVSIAQGPEQDIKAGIGVKLKDASAFGKVTFRNPSVAAMTLTIATGDGDIDDSSLVISGDVPTYSVFNGVESPAAVTVTDAGQALAADTAVRERWLQNNGGSDIWIGDSNVDPANKRGYKIVVGAGLCIAGNCAFTVKTAVGTSSTLSILNMKRV